MDLLAACPWPHLLLGAGAANWDWHLGFHFFVGESLIELEFSDEDP